MIDGIDGHVLMHSADHANDDEFMLTTIDNPWSPFTHYEEWKKYDLMCGHNTYETLAVLGNFGLHFKELSSEDFSKLVDATIDRLIDTDPSGKWIKVWKDTVIQPTPLAKVN